MSMLELIITNAPPKAVRARYAAESRGFITGENGEKVQLQVRNKTGKAWCFDGAKCTGEVKSVATKETHTLYSLRQSEWDVTIEENGCVKVDLHHLAVEINSGRNQKQKSDRGEFYLEFKLTFAGKDLGPDLICRTDDILDISCKETRPPTIKNVNPQCAAGSEEVWIQCTSDVAKTKMVQAIFSGMIGNFEVHFAAQCQVEGKLVKFDMPCLQDGSINDMVKLQLRLRVNKNDNIASDPVPFGYLPKKFYRPKIADWNNEMLNSRTNDPRPLQTVFPSMNTECGVVTGLIPPKGLSNPGNLDFDESKPSKAFRDTKNPWLDEKAQNTSSEVMIRNWIKSRTLPETNRSTGLQHSIEKTVPSTVIEVELLRIQRAESYSQDLGDYTDTVQSPERCVSSSYQNNADTSLSGIEQGCNTESISTPSAGKDFENNPISTGNGKHLNVSPNHNLNDNACHLEMPNKLAPEKIARFQALTLSQNNVGVSRNHSDLLGNCNSDMPTSSWPPCSPGMEEELPPGNLSPSITSETARNEQKCVASISSTKEQFGHVPAHVSFSSLSNNLDTSTGTGDRPFDIQGDLPGESAQQNLSVSATNKNFDGLVNCRTPHTTHETIPVQVTDENSPPQVCYPDLPSRNDILGVPVLNHSNDPPCHSLTTTTQPISNSNDYSEMDISLESLRSAHETVESMGSEGWADLREHVNGNKDILKEMEAKGTNTNMMKRKTVSNYPNCNHNPSCDLHGQPKAKIRRFS